MPWRFGQGTRELCARVEQVEGRHREHERAETLG